MITKNKIGIVVLHYGNQKNTINCLKSLKKLTYKNIKVFVVDNGTHSLTNKWLDQIIPHSNLIQNPYNKGFSAGVNDGIRKALQDKQIKYILILNNDAVVNPQLIEKLINASLDPKIGIIGTIITYYANPQAIWFAGGKLNSRFCFTRHKFMNKPLKTNISTNNVDFITGAMMFVKQEVFKSIGLFDEDYFLYWEDVDFCTRAADKGYKIFCLNEPLVKHKVSSASGTEGSNRLSPIRSYYYARNPFLFMKKHRLPLITGVVGQVFIRLPYYLFQTNNIRSAIEYCRGLLDGIRILFH